MLTRYAAFAVPFVVIVIAAAVAELARAARGAGAVFAAALAAGTALVAAAGVAGSHRAQGFYLDARGVAAYVRANELTGDAVIASSDPAVAVPLVNYGLRPQWSGATAATMLAREHRGRLWVIFELPANGSSAASVLAFVQRIAVPFGYRELRARVFPGIVPLAVVLEAPLAPAARR
jgi:hypothetical protein